MAFVHLDSFQRYGSGGQISANPAYAGSGFLQQDQNTSRWGTKVLRIENAQLIGATSQSTAVVGTLHANWKQDNVSAGTPIFQILQGQSLVQISIGTTAAGAIEARYGGNVGAHNGTVIGAGAAGAVTTGIWYNIEGMFEINATTGKIKIYRDGELVLDLTGVKTNGQATMTWSHFALNAGNNITRRYSDLFLTDTFVRIGERKFEQLLPTANGAAQDFVANTGAAWDAINDLNPDDDATYIASGTVGNRSTFALQDLPVNPTAIDLVLVRAYVRKDDAASRAIKLGLFDGTNISQGSDKFVAATYAHTDSTFPLVAPDGGAWTKAKVDALLLAVDVTA